MRFSSRNAARKVTPPTKMKERIASPAAFMLVASHLDLCDPPYPEEADRLESQTQAQEHRRRRRLEEGGEVIGVDQLEHDRERDRAQADQDGAPPMLRREHPCVAE